MEIGRQNRFQRIDKERANAARSKTKAKLKNTGQLADLSYEELLVLLADITMELNTREVEAGAPRFPGPLRHMARRILE